VFILLGVAGGLERSITAIGRGELSLPVVGAILLVFIVLWVTLILAMSCMKKSFEAIATKLNVSMFKTVATLYWIGALLTIVVIGLLVLFIGNILKIVAYFSIPEEVLPLPPPPPPRS